MSYPLSIPDSPSPKSIEFMLRSIVGMSTSIFTGAQQVYAYPGSFWEVKVTLPPMNQEEAGAWVAFLAELNGREGTFKIGPIIDNVSRKRYSGLVDGSNQSGRTLASKGWPTNVENLLLKGDFIEFDDYIYMVTADVDSDASGNADISIWPRMKASTNNSSITTDTPQSTFRLKNNTNSFSIDELRNFGLNFTAIEGF